MLAALRVTKSSMTSLGSSVAASGVYDGYADSMGNGVGESEKYKVVVSLGTTLVTVHGHAVIVRVVGPVTVIVSPFVVMVVGDGQ